MSVQIDSFCSRRHSQVQPVEKAKKVNKRSFQNSEFGIKEAKIIRNLNFNTHMSQQIQQAAIGIDIGSWRSVIAVAKRGGVQVITNEANFRQTPCVVGYGPNQRFIGESGNVKMKTNFRDTVNYPTRFLGLLSDYPHLREETKFVPAKTVKGENGKFQFAVNYQGQNEAFVAEQVVAAFLNKLRNIIHINKLDNKEAVLSVPSYYTQIERKALLDAAKIAQLNVTRLFNESTAIALDYGIFRKADLDATTPRNILFVDFGHSKLSTFVCSFTKEKMITLAQHHERNLGCRDIDYIVLEYYRGIFEKTSGGSDVFESKKAVVKLMENIERQRKILSANIEHTMNLEYLMDESDLIYNMKREEFQKLAEPVFLRIHQALQKIKAEINQKKIHIHSIEMVGGGTRIPAFHKILADSFKIEPSRTLNSSESIAKGCALMAAMRSPLFRVADYGLEEINNYPIRIYWNFMQNNHAASVNEKQYPEKQTNLLFPSGATIPITKTLKFSRKEAIEILLAYDPVVEGFGRHIAYFKSPIQHPKQQQFSVVFKFKINDSGLLVFDEHYLQEQYIEETKVPKKKQEKKDDKKEEKKDEKKEQPKPEEFQIKQTKKTRQIPIKLEQVVVVQKNTAKEIEKYFEVEGKMLNDDKVVFETYERKNQLQSLIYNNKEKLGSTYKDFVNPADVPKILAALEEANNWLYGDGQNSTRGVYQSKIESLRPFVDPISKRYHNFEEIKNSYYLAIQAMESNTVLLNSVDPKYSHITAEERQAGHLDILNLKTILENAERVQNTIPKWQNPAITSAQLNKHIQELNTKVKKIMNRPVPPPPKPQQKKPEQAPQGQAPKPEEATKMQEQKPAQKMEVEKQ